jgi:hypothetical protein
MPARRTINISVTLWTDGIAAEPGGLVEKTAWNYGTARFKPNELHGISGNRTVTFNKPQDLWSAIQRAADAAGVTLLDAKTGKPEER